MELAPYSVLMSVYYKEKPEYLREALHSMLSQTVPPSEILLVQDGPLTPELERVLDEEEALNPGVFARVPLERNMGLGNALRIGVEKCRYELIARMDTDDIACPARCEKQLRAFAQDPGLDICGTMIDEFEQSPDKVVSRRVLPCTHEEILAFSKKRNPFNHMTVMFKKSAVLAAGNYQEVNLIEDYYLWVRMLLRGAKSCNLPESLVYARVGAGMMERRGGLSYWKKIAAGRNKIRRTGYIGWGTYLQILAVQFVFCIVPVSLREKLYHTFLRK